VAGKNQTVVSRGARAGDANVLPCGASACSAHRC